MPYTALIDMGMLLQMATPSSEDRQTQYGSPNKWSYYVHKVSSIILARHSLPERIICVNDPYNVQHSTKYNERDLKVHGKIHVPNTYMKLRDPLPSAQELKTLLCSDSNKGRLQKLLCDYLTNVAESVNVDIAYSVGSHCTNLSTRGPMEMYNFDQSETDTILFPSTHFCASPATMVLLSLMPVIQMPMSLQLSSRSS